MRTLSINQYIQLRIHHRTLYPHAIIVRTLSICSLRNRIISDWRCIVWYADISSRDVIEMMMITQYFDMLKDIGMNSTGGAIFLPHSPGNVADVSSEVNL